MEWSWHDPERGELTKWWTIDPQTGKPDGDGASPTVTHCLGDSALDAAGEAGDAVATNFAIEVLHE